jgi:hypothetical protein
MPLLISYTKHDEEKPAKKYHRILNKTKFWLRIPLTLFILLILTIPVTAIDSNKWDLVTHQEIVPQQSFPVGDYTITLADRNKNGVDDYTVIVYIEHNGNKQTELMRDGDTVFFDDDHSKLEYVGTQNDKQVFNAYHEKGYPYGSVGDVPIPVNTPAQSEVPNIPFENSNLMSIGAIILLVGIRKR